MLQARDLGELQEALDEVRSVGGPKVRRLETLVNQVKAAQENRQLAAAESDRAQRLARDLRVALRPRTPTRTPAQARARLRRSDCQRGRHRNLEPEPAAEAPARYR